MNCYCVKCDRKMELIKLVPLQSTRGRMFVFKCYRCKIKAKVLNTPNYVRTFWRNCK